VYARLIGAHAMDLSGQKGFEKPDNGRVGDHHAREQVARPMQEDPSVLGSDIAKPVWHMMGVDTTGKVLVRKRGFAHRV
jgi:hypothetical protein